MALGVLDDLEAPVDLEDLSAVVAEREDSGRGTGAEARSSVAVALHHVHLPMMDDVGVLEYDHETRRIVSYSPSACH